MTDTNATSVKIQRLRAGGHGARAPIAVLLALSSALGAEGTAFAETDDVVGKPAVAAALATPGTLPPYSLPWQLRPVTGDNVARNETTAAVFNDANGNLDVAVVTMVTASYQVTKEWAPIVRLGFVGNDAPGAALDGRSFVNPIVGATYGRQMGSYRLALFGATTIPVGTGGGNTPNLAAAKANAASITARPADNAMFEVNYMTGIIGVDFAYVNRGFTAQGEATLLQFVRVRGKKSANDLGPSRTSSSVGLHLGYFMGAHFSLGGDLHYQRLLSHPTTRDVIAGPSVRFAQLTTDMVTVAVGTRLHFRLGKQSWIRPGISFARGLDARGLKAPLITAQTSAVQIDIPVMF